MGVYFYLFIINNRFQVRHSVIVIPRSDAESSVCGQRKSVSLASSGFRVGARNDNYRVPHLKENK